MFLPLTTFCQSSDTTKTKQIAVGLSFSPDYCYRTLKPDASREWIKDIRDTFEIPKIGFTTGLNLIYNLNNRMSLETGLLFSDKGERTRKYDLHFLYPDPSYPTHNTFIWHYLYLDIPIKINYRILTPRTKLYLSAGILVNLFLTEKTISILEYSDGHTKTNNSTGNTGFSIINVACIAGFGISYDLSDKVTIKVEPTYRRSITSIIHAPIKGYLYSAGINFGINYNI